MQYTETPGKKASLLLLWLELFSGLISFGFALVSFALAVYRFPGWFVSWLESWFTLLSFIAGLPAWALSSAIGLLLFALAAFALVLAQTWQKLALEKGTREEDEKVPDESTPDNSSKISAPQRCH